jgi:sugar lactone lactonase YvrE
MNTILGEQQAILKDFKQFPNGVCWDPRGKYVLTLSTDREMHVIGVEPPRFPRLRRVIKADLPQFPDFDNQAGVCITFGFFYIM